MVRTVAGAGRFVKMERLATGSWRRVMNHGPRQEKVPGASVKMERPEAVIVRVMNNGSGGGARRALHDFGDVITD